MSESRQARRPGRRGRQAAWLIVALLVVTGCADSPGEKNQPTASWEFESTKEESWDVYLIDGKRVGYAHTTVRRPVGEGPLRIDSENYLKVKRFGDTAEQRVVLRSLERPDGGLVKYESEMSLGPNKITSRGEVVDGALRSTTVTQGKEVPSSMPWDDRWGGYFAVDMELRRRPMKPGEKRRLKALVPVFNQVAEIELTAREKESTRLMDTERVLLRVESVTNLAGQRIDATLWLDERGETIKSHTPNLNQTSYRSTKEIAVSEAGLGDYDLAEATTVRLNRRLDDPMNTREVVYRASIEGQDPSKVFSGGASQSVERLEDGSARIVVRAVRPGQPETLDRPEKPPGDADRQPNNMIQSDDPAIVRMAGAVSPDEKDAWRVAGALEAHVHRSMKRKDFTQAFATAAEVAESMQGDCTEHAVLLAALCRARDIPARVAIGLVYYERGRQPRFAYHMWTEVWIDDRWIPIDATLGRGGIGAAHLKLTDSDLRGAQAYSAFLPVFQVLGRLKLEIESAR